MSEKKTAEIKLRIEPSVKAQWQQSAADEGIGLSEFIGLACEGRREMALWTKQNLAMDSGGAVLNSAIAALRADPNFTHTHTPVPTSEAEKKFGADWKPWGDAA